ncbi:MAG TPA: GNAT family N-acetyltransferase [Acidimicrobiales bacterium]|nr:GNAT family N-acetyltransferase [Acidimicrobiales bacterium]
MPSRLERHLRAWLGAWPPTGELDVVTAPGRVEPGWDGRVHQVVGVASPGGIVLSVPPDLVADVEAAAEGGLDNVSRRLAELLDRPASALGSGVFRWAESVTPLPDAGVWLPARDARLPEWLHPFGGDVLVALAGDEYAAGVGIKRHDRFGQELAVGTEPRFAGQGLGRRLVAQAGRRVIEGGAVPTYLHDPRNGASAKVAAAAGFPDRGWKVLGFWP